MKIPNRLFGRPRFEGRNVQRVPWEGKKLTPGAMLINKDSMVEKLLGRRLVPCEDHFYFEIVNIIMLYTLSNTCSVVGFKVTMFERIPGNKPTPFEEQYLLSECRTTGTHIRAKVLDTYTWNQCLKELEMRDVDTDPIRNDGEGMKPLFYEVNCYHDPFSDDAVEEHAFFVEAGAKIIGTTRQKLVTHTKKIRFYGDWHECQSDGTPCLRFKRVM